MNTGDEEIIRKAQTGNPIAMNRLVERWYPRIYHFALRYTLDANDAKEIGQNTFISVFQNINQLREPSKFKYWLYRIAHRHCRKFYKEQHRQFPLEGLNGDTQLIITDGGQRNLERDERKVLIIKALQDIPQNQREVIVLKEYEGLKFKEIAKILNISENTAKSRMYYGLKAMKKILIHHPDIKEICHANK